MKNINFKKVILAFSIMVVLNIFFNMGISAFYKQPKWEDFCSKINANYLSKNSCESVGGFWVPNTVSYDYKGVDQAAPTKPIAVAPCTITNGVTSCPIDQGYHCDVSVEQNKCQAAYTDKINIYNRNVFIVLIVLGIASVIGGFFFERSGAVSLGLSLGGVLSLLIGTIRYWSSMQEFFRFAVSGVALAALIWLGVKKFGDKKDEAKEETKNEGV